MGNENMIAMRAISHKNALIIEAIFKARGRDINRLTIPGRTTPTTIYDWADEKGKGNIVNATAAKAGIRPIRKKQLPLRHGHDRHPLR
jgi:hypothetical protein